MPFSDGLSELSSATLTWLVIIAGLSVVLYFARQPAHQAIMTFAHLLYRALRVASAALMRGEEVLRQRNREVLLAAGRDAAERMIEREFERIDGAVRRDLGTAPALHRKMNDTFTQIAEDYSQSADVPPSPPGWVEAVDAVARIPSNGDPVVTAILQGVHDTLIEERDKATTAYRDASRERHKRLQGIVPGLRSLMRLLGSLDKNITSLTRRTEIIDRQIEEYEGILKQEDSAVRQLSSSSLIQFFVSAFVLAIAVGGAAINFHLIARPMSEMVGGNSLIGSVKTADVAALVIILVEISMGLFLMESLRITRLFPVIGALPDLMRQRMIWVTFGILFMLASVEAGLSYMREVLLQDELATTALLRGEAGAAFENGFVWITTAAQMGMGFVLPFALVFVAIPLETFVQSLRTVLGILAMGLLRFSAAGLRVTAGAVRHGAMMIEAYDLLIFGPLWLDRQVRGHFGDRRRTDEVHRAEVPEPFRGEAPTIREMPS